MRTKLAVLLTPFLLSGGVALGADKKPGQVPDPKKVEAAIARGRTWLEECTRRGVKQARHLAVTGDDPMVAGKLALSAFALLRAGAPAKELEQVFAFLRRRRFKWTYTASLYILALEAKHMVRRRVAEPRRLATYERKTVSRADLREMQRVTRWLLSQRTKGTARWGYGITRRHIPYSYDNSNTQFAVYGLDAASRSGIRISAAVWAKVAEHFLKEQEGRGESVDLSGSVALASSPLRSLLSSAGRAGKPFARGWGYGRFNGERNQKPSASMTAAGVSSLAMAFERLGKLGKLKPAWRQRCLRAMRDGVAWLARKENWSPDLSPPQTEPGYCLWSVEKAMDAVGVEVVGKRDWWSEAASLLLRTQNKNGSWGKVAATAWFPIETCFALLVLTRSTLSGYSGSVAKKPAAKPDPQKKRRVRTGAGQGTWDVVEVPGRGKVGLRQSLQILAAASSSKARKLLGEVRKAWPLLDPGLKPRLVPAVKRLLKKGGARRRWARRALKEIAKKPR